MTRRISSTSLFLALLVALPVVASPPPNPTPSDSMGNTAGGTNAFFSNPVAGGGNSTGFGYEVLHYETIGSDNSAFGAYALYNDTLGEENTAVGVFALSGMTMGQNNTAVGYAALVANVNGYYNTAVGESALSGYTGGWRNTAVGTNAMLGGTGTVNDNIAIGYNAGQSLAGDNNIDIGNQGAPLDTGVIRIGTAGTHTATYVAGVLGATVLSGAQVVVGTGGRLGTITSSARYKKDIVDMGEASDKLLALRPVTFHYKTDQTNTRQYGLIAEEVAKIYPDLVMLNEEGKPETVLYQELPAMLLNEVQKQAKELADARTELKQMHSQHDKEVAELEDLRSMIAAQSAVVNQLKSKLEEPVRVASR